jgi:nucleotidyltransferase/DNA polymerase involved in DNA repair
MDNQPLIISSYPRAIVHIDGDAFFAFCEQARNPKLQGKPVVMGKERGIAASMSYEAKARGVVRGMLPQHRRTLLKGETARKRLGFLCSWRMSHDANGFSPGPCNLTYAQFVCMMGTYERRYRHYAQAHQYYAP